MGSDLHYKDSRETRIFCFERHELSYKLPEMVKSASSHPCYVTDKDNFFIIDMANDKGVKKEHEVYFKVSKVGRGLLRLFVLSSYLRDDKYSSSQPKKKKIGFFVIAKNRQEKKTIKTHK